MTVIKIDNGVRVTDPGDTSCQVVLRPMIEKTQKFTARGLTGFEVLEVPAPVWAFIFQKDKYCHDGNILLTLAASGWNVRIEASDEVKLVALSMFSRDAYLSVAE